MRKMICPKCGSSNAKDFIFKVLCPERKCVNFDAKLAEEQDQNEIDKLVDTLYDFEPDLDFIAGADFILDLSDDDTDVSLYLEELLSNFKREPLDGKK